MWQRFHLKKIPTWAISNFRTPSVKPRFWSDLISCPSLYHTAEVSFFMLPTWKKKTPCLSTMVRSAVFVACWRTFKACSHLAFEHNTAFWRHLVAQIVDKMWAWVKPRQTRLEPQRVTGSQIQSTIRSWESKKYTQIVVIWGILLNYTNKNNDILSIFPHFICILFTDKAAQLILPCFLNHSFLWNSDSFCSSLKTANMKHISHEKHFISHLNAYFTCLDIYIYFSVYNSFFGAFATL